MLSVRRKVGYKLEEKLKDAKLNIKAIEEICYAIEKANGYYYDYVLEMLIERGIKNKQFH